MRNPCDVRGGHPVGCPFAVGTRPKGPGIREVVTVAGVAIKIDRSDPYSLNSVMEFDHVIEVHPDGTVTDDVPGVYAPELYDGEVSDGWTLLGGYSGQYCYAGPIMHASEFIGGGMADDILSTPGVYVALVANNLDDDEPDGWAVARRND